MRKINLAGMKYASKILIIMACAVGFFSWINLTQASGVISGTVYVDYNMNGVNNTSGAAPNYAIDSGVSGVTVTAYDSSGTVRGTATTGSSGTYTLNASGNGPYRIEFTNIPAGYSPSEIGANNASTVRIVPNGNSSNIDFGIARPADYCQNNPNIVTNVFAVGSGPYWAFARFPYNYSDELDGRLNSIDPTNWTSPPSRTSLLNPAGFGGINEVGATFGIAYDSRNNRLFASSYLKRGARLGSLSGESTGAIYFATNPSASSPVTGLFVDLNAVFGAGTTGANTHPSGSTSDWTDDTATVPEVGKRGLGGLKLSADGATLYTVNLADRRLYAIPTSGALNSTTIQRFNIPTTGLSTSSGTCASADVRPFAVGRDRSGQIYVGAVCSAESETANTKLHAYIWRFSGSTFTLVANNNLTFTRTAQSGESATWQRWANVTNVINRAAPILSDIEFDGNDMILGIRDRYSDQVVIPDYFRGYGDTMRVCLNGSTFNFESNGGCGSITTPVPSGGNANSGNGGREYYYDLNGDGREEASLGGLTQVPGYDHHINSAYDPVTFNSSGARVLNYYTAGVQRYNNRTGVQTGAYDVYLDADPGNFGKAGGVGDTESLCNAAPLQIGDRVWNDLNSNGIQDSNEVGIQNVALQLWADTNSDSIVDLQIGSALTDSSGNYIFGGAANSNLSSYTCGTTSGSVDVSVNTSTDDADEKTDGKMNALNRSEIRMAAEVNASGVRFQNITVPRNATITNAYIQFTSDDSSTTDGTPTVIITGEANDNAPTFGSSNNNISARPNTTASVNWTIPAWSTDRQTGANQRTPAITSIVQELVNRSGWASGNSMVFKIMGGASGSRRDAESFDGGAGFAPRLVVEYTVPSTCSYSLSPNTNYEVRIPSSNFNSGQPLNNFSPTAANADQTANGTSRDSNGISAANNQIVAPVLTGSYGANDHTIDFGFKTGQNYSIGNRVWFDTNNDGIINAGEQGIGNLAVSLFLDANNDGVPDTPGSPVQTVITDSGGYYRFDQLSANNYIVCVDPVNFVTGGRLERYRNVSDININPVDSSGSPVNAENGRNTVGPMNNIVTEGIITNSVTMSGPFAPTSEPDVPASGNYPGQGSLDNRADMTIDVGFYSVCLNGTLWNDTSGAGNNDGLLNNGETGIPFVRVQLYDSSGTLVPVGPDGILGTADDNSDGSFTNSAGNYSFCGLPPRQYRVAVLGGGTSSTPTSNTPDDNIDSDDNGFPGSGQFAGVTVSNLVTLTPGNAGALANNSVSNSTGTTTNPTVDFGFIVAPSLVKLDGFAVYSDGTGNIVKWSTAEEFDNLGFNVYREVQGKRELLNYAMIAGSSLRSTANLVASGEEYVWVDKQPVSGAVYYLEDFDMNGNSTLHGPVHPSLNFSSIQSKPVFLADPEKNGFEPKEKEFVDYNADIEDKSQDLYASNADRQKQIAAEKGIKISVNHDAWYRVSAQELAAAGFDPNTNRDYWQLFANGEEIPFRQNENGSIEFFGSGNDKISTDSKVYYLISGSERGLRLESANGGNSEIENAARSFAMTTVRDDRAIYVSAIRNGDDKNFFGSVITTSAATLQTLTVKNIDDAGQANLRVRLQGLATGNHLVNIRFNGIDLGTVSFLNEENRTFNYDLPVGSILEGSNQLQIQAVNSGNDVSLVDSISLTYPRRFIAVDNKLRFTVPAGQSVRVGGFEKENLGIFEIKNGRALREIVTELEKVDGTPGISLASANSDREFLVLDESRTESVAKIEWNTPSYLSNRKNGADFVIIANGKLLQNAEELAAIRRSQGLETRVIDVEDVYDEFSFGEHSPEAIREFLRVATENWVKKPRYALFFGDASYDPRNYGGLGYKDLVPTKLIDTLFQETTSDAWLADFNDDGIEDISIGRFPVLTADEANSLVSKFRNYDTQIDQQRSGALISDRGFQYYNDVLRSEMPGEAVISRIDRSSMTDAAMRSAILAKLNSGPTVVTYTGHGAPSLWAAAGVFQTADVAAVNNQNLSVYLLMTCLNGYFASPNYDSISEAFLKKTNGGAIAVWASSGTTYPDKQLEISRILTRDLFNERQGTSRLGDLMRNAKHGTTARDVRQTWHLLGDPTVLIK